MQRALLFSLLLPSCFVAADRGQPSTPITTTPIPNAPRIAGAALEAADADGNALMNAHALVWGWPASAAMPRDSEAPTDGDDDGEEEGVTGSEIGETYALDAHGRVIAQAAGVIVRARGRLFAFDVRTRSLARTPCHEGEMAAEEEAELAADPTRDVDEAAFVDLQTGRRIGVSAFDPSSAQDFHYGARLVATIGDRAFIRHSSWAYTCGAHGSSYVTAGVVDIATGENVEVPLRANDMKVARAAANGLLAEREHDGPFRLDDRSDDTLALVELLPIYNERGSLSFQARFSTSACYACTSGGWSSYTAAARVALRRPPPKLEELAVAPRVVASFAAARKDFRIGGYSAPNAE